MTQIRQRIGRWPILGSQLALIISLALYAQACGGGGGQALTFDPDEPTPTRISSADQRVIAVLPAGALTSAAQLSLTNRSAEDAAVPGPEGRTLVMAMEFTAQAEPAQPPAEEPPAESETGGENQTSQADGNGGDGGTGDGGTPTADEEVTLAATVEITFLLDATLPAAMSIPIYTYNASSARYEDASITATVSDDGTELVFSITEFGRYAFYSLLPEETPPPAPTGLVLVAASTQVRKLRWDAASDPAVTGYNLYRAPAGEDAFAIVNAEPLSATEYVDELPGPGAYDYYLTTANAAALESEPGATVQSPAVDFDLHFIFGEDRLVEPETLALSAATDTLLIADPGARCVWVYSLSGHYRTRITGYHTLDFIEPRGLAINPSGTRIYISDARGTHVYIYDSSYREVGLFGTWGYGPGEFQRPIAVQVVYDAEVIGDVVLVADETLSTLQSFTGLGVYLDTHAAGGIGEGELASPSYMLATEAGESLYIADSGNARVQVFNAELEFDSVIQLLVDDGGPLLAPLGIELDFRGRIYVSDSGNRRVVVFDEAGEKLFHFGAEGDLRVEFSAITGPHGLALDRTTGYLYVSDTGNQRIVVFTS